MTPFNNGTYCASKYWNADCRELHSCETNKPPEISVWTSYLEVASCFSVFILSNVVYIRAKPSVITNRFQGESVVGLLCMQNTRGHRESWHEVVMGNLVPRLFLPPRRGSTQQTEWSIMAWSPLKRYFLATLVFSVCSVIACGTSIFGPRKTHGSHYQKFPNRTAALMLSAFWYKMLSLNRRVLVYRRSNKFHRHRETKI